VPAGSFYPVTSAVSDCSVVKLLLRLFDKRSKFFTDRKDSEFPFVMLCILSKGMVLATAVAVFRLLDQRNLSSEFFRSCRN